MMDIFGLIFIQSNKKRKARWMLFEAL
jgi:hypothetical protein